MKVRKIFFAGRVMLLWKKKIISIKLKPKVKIDELNAKVTEDGNALFDSNGRHI